MANVIEFRNYWWMDDKRIILRNCYGSWK